MLQTFKGEHYPRRLGGARGQNSIAVVHRQWQKHLLFLLQSDVGNGLGGFVDTRISGL